MTSQKPKKFLNDPSEAVSEMISGLLLQYPNSLRKLSNHNVLLSSSVASSSTFDHVNMCYPWWNIRQSRHFLDASCHSCFDQTMIMVALMDLMWNLGMVI